MKTIADLAPLLAAVVAALFFADWIGHQAVEMLEGML